MPAPINYTAMQPQQDFGQRILQGLQLAGAMNDIQKQRQQEEAAAQMRQQYAADVEKAYSNPTPEAFSRLIANYPGQREALAPAWKMLDEKQRDSEFLAGTQAYSALTAGKPEVAMQLIDERITAAQNSGGDVTKLKAIRQTISEDPKTAAAHLGFVLSAVDPDRWKKMTETLETKSKADKAAVDAKFAESAAATELEKKGWDIKKLQSDIEINKENARIAAIAAAEAREGNFIKREELKMRREEMMQKRDELVRGKSADVATARGNFDNMLGTLDRILKTPLDVVKSATGPLSSKMLTTSQDTADFEELVSTVDAQSFLAQIPNIKGMGALSDAEGKKLAAALQNFSLRQSDARLLANAKEAQRLLLIARKNLANRYGVPDDIPNTPEATATGSAGKSTDDILKELGVM